jgi:putative transposase
LCQEFGISAKTGYKWRERFIEHGIGGLEEQSRKPKSSPAGLDEPVVCEMIRIKQKHPHWGARKIRRIYARTHEKTPSESSFKRVFERSGYTEKRRVRPMREAGRLQSGRKAQAPNEIWTVDFKGWWYGGEGRRCEPLTVRDEFSRFVLDLRAMSEATGRAVRQAFERLFERRGLPNAIRSDNGSPFASVGGVLGLTQLSAWWVALGIDLERSRPGHPQDNGAHERLHLDISRELEKSRLGEDQAVFDEWKQTFNQERPHEALGLRTPAEVYTPAPRRFEGTPEDIDYPGMERRKVQTHGNIHWEGQAFFISTALQGWSIGLEGIDGARSNVWFGRLLLGQLDVQTASFERTKATPKDLEKTAKSAALRAEEER